MTVTKKKGWVVILIPDEVNEMSRQKALPETES